jgi:hypothetical protein
VSLKSGQEHIACINHSEPEQSLSLADLLNVPGREEEPRLDVGLYRSKPSNMMPHLLVLSNTPSKYNITHPLPGSLYRVVFKLVLLL